MARSNLFPKAYEWEKLKKCTFLYAVVLCNMQMHLAPIPLDSKGQGQLVTLVK